MVVRSDVSSSVARDYDVLYQNLPGKSPEEAAMAAASDLVSEQQKNDIMLSSVPDEVEEEIMADAAMSLSHLLNPVHPSSQSHIPGAQAVKALIWNGPNGAHLANNKLLNIRASHDSQVQKHHGNERAKIDIEALRKASTDVLKPSECSKLVAVVMKSMEATPTGVSRTHRWNISVKLDLSKHTRNTSTSLDLPSRAIITGGGISKENPIEHGKFVVIIKNGVSTLHFSSCGVVKLLN